MPRPRKKKKAVELPKQYSTLMTVLKILGLILSVAVVSSGAAAAYYKGLSSLTKDANTYTDKKDEITHKRIDRIEDQVIKKLDVIYTKQEAISEDLSEVKVDIGQIKGRIRIK